MNADNGATFSRDFSDPESEGRNGLFDRVRDGELSPAQAEAEAELRGWGSLSERPELSLFDPMKKSIWSLPMTLAWIMWRNPSDVREWDNDWRQGCWDWKKFSGRTPDANGEVEKAEFWGVEQRSPVSVDAFVFWGHLRDQAEDDQSSKEPSNALEAKDELWSALQEGELIATALPASGGVRSEIPAIQWHDLKADAGRGYRGDELFLCQHPSAIVYRDPALRRRDILERWSSGMVHTGIMKRSTWGKLEKTISVIDILWPDSDPTATSLSIKDQIIDRFVQDHPKQTISSRTITSALAARRERRRET